MFILHPGIPKREKSRVSRLLLQKLQIKVCEKCFLCHSVVLCSTWNKCQKCCTKSACRGQISKLLANLAGSGNQSKSSSDPKRGLHPPLPDPAKTNKVSHGHKLLCQSPQEQLPVEGITSAYSQECCRTSKTPNISGVFQQTIFSPKAQQQVETYIRFEQTESLPQDGEIQNGDSGNHQNVPPTRGVGYLNRFQGRLLPYPNTGTVQEISEISCPRSDIPVQGTVLWSVHSTLGVHCNSKEVKLMAIHRGIRIHQCLDDWLVRVTSHQACLQHTQILVKICQKLGWLVNLDKSELDSKQIFDFIALIHPIQWTIAYPVGADRPAKRQKKTSCVSTPARPVQYCALARWRVVLPSCLDRVTS